MSSSMPFSLVSVGVNHFLAQNNYNLILVQ